MPSPPRHWVRAGLTTTLAALSPSSGKPEGSRSGARAGEEPRWERTRACGGRSWGSEELPASGQKAGGRRPYPAPPPSDMAPGRPGAVQGEMLGSCCGGGRLRRPRCPAGEPRSSAGGRGTNAGVVRPQELKTQRRSPGASQRDCFVPGGQKRRRSPCLGAAVPLRVVLALASWWLRGFCHGKARCYHGGAAAGESGRGAEVRASCACRGLSSFTGATPASRPFCLLLLRAPNRNASSRRSLAGQGHHKLSACALARKPARSSPSLETPLTTSPQSFQSIGGEGWGWFAVQTLSLQPGTSRTDGASSAVRGKAICSSES